MAVYSAAGACDAARFLLLDAFLLLSLLYRVKEADDACAGSVCHSPCGHPAVRALCAHQISVSGNAVGDGAGHSGSFLFSCYLS